MTIWNATDKNTRARELGYNDYDHAIVTMYRDEELSYRQTGDWFSMTWYATAWRLKNLDVPARPRGGKNHKLSYYTKGKALWQS